MNTNIPETACRWLLLVGMLSALPLPALAQIDCETLPHWIKLGDGLQLNQRHVFCGEWSQNRPKGFHARPGGTDPATVAQFSVQSKPNVAGIYTGRWSYQKHPDKNKFSSLFPDQCSAVQVINSIRHAATQANAQCPPGSPDWVRCGYNKPDGETGQQYCSVNGTRFVIGFAPPKAGKINTAFPFFE